MEHEHMCFTWSFAHVARDIDFWVWASGVSARTENRGFIFGHWRLFSAYK